MAVTVPMTQAQIDAELQRKKNAGIAPTSAGNQAAYDKLTPTVPNTPGAAIGATVGSKLPVQNTVPFVGPTLDGSRPQVPVPNVVTPNPTPIPTPSGDGRLQGPYPTPSGGIQQGVNVVNNQMQYDQPTVPTPAAPPVPTVNSQPTTPQPSLYKDPYARSPEDIAKLAADRIAKILAAGRTARDGALAGTKNAYDYTNQIQGDSRQLRNAGLKDSSNPYGGLLNYQQAQNNRSDSLQDTTEDKDYNAAVGQINQKLADLEAAAPGDEQAIIDELQQIERQTGINVTQLQLQQQQQQYNQGQQDKEFSYNQGQDAIKNGQNQQVIDYNQDPNNPNNVGQTLQNQLAQYQLADYPAESKARATLLQQQVKSGALSQEAAEYNLKQLKDPNSNYNQAAKIDLQLKQLDLKNAPEKARLEIQQLQKQIAEIGKVHTQPQSAADQAADQVKLANANKQLADIAKGIYPGDKDAKPPETVEDYAKNYLDGLAKYDDDGVVINGPALESQILSSGKTEAEMKKMYARYGLKWG